MTVCATIVAGKPKVYSFNKRSEFGNRGYRRKAPKSLKKSGKKELEEIKEDESDEGEHKSGDENEKVFCHYFLVKVFEVKVFLLY